eukprot:scaffold13398_cov23-Prasinocladus_malaysianus.AAC.1
MICSLNILPDGVTAVLKHSQSPRWAKPLRAVGCVPLCCAAGDWPAALSLGLCARDTLDVLAGGRPPEQTSGTYSHHPSSPPQPRSFFLSNYLGNGTLIRELFSEQPRFDLFKYYQ